MCRFFCMRIRYVVESRRRGVLESEDCANECAVSIPRFYFGFVFFIFLFFLESDGHDVTISREDRICRGCGSVSLGGLGGSFILPQASQHLILQQELFRKLLLTCI